MGMNPESARLFFIFFPHAAANYVRLRGKQNVRFVQYTRAESAIKMLRSKSVWMRKAQWMNDYREIEHGWQSLLRTYRETKAGERFKTAMDAAHTGISKEITDNFDPWVEEYRLNTFVTSISEHEPDEDQNGRLSMWRAYGGNSGVAMVVNSTPFMTASDALGAYSSPVAYFSQAQVESHFDGIASAIESNVEFIRSIPRPQIVGMVHESYRFGMICCKHPGFAEEREWRIVYNPQRDQKKVLKKSIEFINGIAQPVYSLPLQNIHGYANLEVASILDRVIIGPTQFPGALLEAFRSELAAAGVANPDSKVVFSDIPLRPQ